MILNSLVLRPTWKLDESGEHVTLDAIIIVHILKIYCHNMLYVYSLLFPRRDLNTEVVFAVGAEIALFIIKYKKRRQFFTLRILFTVTMSLLFFNTKAFRNRHLSNRFTSLISTVVVYSFVFTSNVRCINIQNYWCIFNIID